MNIQGIDGGSSQGVPAKAAGTMDAESRNLQKQIAEAQKKLQEISADDALSQEEKTKKRQEIRKEISDLRLQLRQHQMEVRRQKQEEKPAAGAGTANGSGKAEACAAGEEKADREKKEEMEEGGDTEKEAEGEPGLYVDIRL